MALVKRFAVARERRMDWKTIGNYALLISLFVTMVTMFNQSNDRMDRMRSESNARLDRLQAETNARFDAAQVENSRRHDDLNRRFDEMFEVLRTFEGRISRLEGRLDEQSGAGTAE